MTNVTLNRKAIEAILGKKLDTEELKQAITYLGTDLDTITDDEITVEIFPNRPDLLSDEGMARALLAFLEIKPGLKRYRAKTGAYQINVEASKETMDPYATGAVITGLSLDDKKLKSIIQVQEKMHVSFGRGRARVSIGIYPMEHITFPLTYCTKKLQDIAFTPLGFSKKMHGEQILQEHPTGKEFRHLITGEEANCWIDAKGKTMALVPIINAEDIGKVTQETTSVFIDVSGTDMYSCEQGLTLLCCMFADMGGSIHRCTVHVDGKTFDVPTLQTPELPIDILQINTTLGTTIAEKELPKLLAKMGMEYAKNIVTIPCYRTDILHPCDIIEDVAIAYGYNNIVGVVPSLYTESGEDSQVIFNRTVNSILIGYGFLETKSYHLTSAEKDRQFTDQKPITLLHSVSADYDVLRSTLAGNIVEILAKNAHHTYPHIIFESGIIFTRNESTETGIEENNHLCGAVAGEEADYTTLRKIVDGIGRALGLLLSYKAEDQPHYLPGRSAAVYHEHTKVGHLGEIHPQVLQFYNISVPVVLFEIDADVLYTLGKRIRQ